MFLSLSMAAAAQGAVQGPELDSARPHDATFAAVESSRAEIDEDGVPLPVPPVYADSETGDVLVAPASGDPFFLGFAAGKHYPPAGERIDPALAQLAAQPELDGRPQPTLYAFVMFEKRMTDARVRELTDLGARVLEFHPHYALKVALPPRALDGVAALDFVRWVGAPQSWQKLHPNLTSMIAASQPGAVLDLYVDVYESDLCADSTSRVVAEAYEADPDGNSKTGNADAAARVWSANGWQQRRLEALGLEVGAWIEEIRAFEVRARAEQIESIVALDFVQFIEPDLPEEPDHDESMPLCNADRVRNTYDGAFSGNCQAGVIDSGMESSHAALDPWAVGWDYTGASDPFSDTSGHGTHVSGTILGNDDVNPSLQGGAPGLGLTTARRFFIVRKGGNAPLSTWLSKMNSDYDDGTDVSPAPHVVNNSYSSNVVTTPFIGSEADCRTIDANAFSNDQLWIWSASNEGPTAGTCGEESVAKNALTVGATTDYYEASHGNPGEIYDGSSRGPCGDGRWKPNVCAPGRWTNSCDAFDSTGYVNKWGTSMSTPLVTGLAAQLADHYSFLRYNPSALSAVLMAGTITKNNQLLTSPGGSAAHLNAYGTGRVDAYKCNYGDSQQGLFFWSFTPTWANGFTQLDFEVLAGATRLTVVFHYKEVAASAGASQALINDLDMYLDAEPFAAGQASGDYTSHQSNVDNSEVRILDNPTVGDWRVKLFPDSMPTGQAVRAGVCVIITYGDTTPDPTLSVTASDYYVQPGDDVTVNATYTNPDYIASGVYLDTTSSGDSLTASYGTLIDGPAIDWTTNQQSGRDVLLGNVRHNSSRTAHWTTSWATQGIKTFAVSAESDNAVDKADDVTIYVDGTAPALPTNLGSSTHTENVWSNDPTITYTWTASTDNVSGVDGYGVFTSTAVGLPGATKDIEQVTSYADSLSDGSWYFMLRPVDNSGNWNASYASTGPYKIDTVDPGAVSGLASTSHSLNVQSCNTTVNMTWNLFVDGGSGPAGFLGVWNTSASTNPIGVPNIAAGSTSYSTNIGSSASARYFHLRTKDVAGNYGPTVHFGPIYANASSVSTYCTGKTNSQGCVPAIGSSGSPSLSSGTFTVTCTNTLNQKNGLLFFGSTASAVPFQGGIKCVAAPTQRGPNTSSGGSPSGNDCSGNYSQVIDAAFAATYSLSVGDTVFAQWWMRDPAIPSTTGLSNAIQFTLCQ